MNKHIFRLIVLRRLHAVVLILVALRLSCAVLLAALIMLAAAGGFSAETYDTYYLAAELYRIPCGVLFLSVVGAAILQERC